LVEEITNEASLLLKSTMHHTFEKVDVNDDTIVNEILSPNICIICDRYIIGTSTLHWISKERIIQHSHRLSVDRWKTVSGLTEINPILRQQYLLNEDGFENILLSPRSRKNDNNCYLCCSTCDGSLRKAYINSSPPKYSFANNFLIGTLPDNAWKNPNTGVNEMNLLLPLMIAPIRPFYYLFCVQGGQCKTLKRHNYIIFKPSVHIIEVYRALKQRITTLPTPGLGYVGIINESS